MRGAAAALASVIGAVGCSFIGYGDSTKPAVDATIDHGDGPQQITLTQSTSTSIGNNSWSCNKTQAQFTYANTYYRVFDLAAAGVTRSLHVAIVTFGVQQALAGSGSAAQPLRLSLGTYGGALGGEMLDDAMITEVAHKDLAIANGNYTTIEVPIGADFAPTDKLVVALAIPDGTAEENVLFLGTNGVGETAPSYWRAPDCQQPTPIWMDHYASAHSLTNADLVLKVGGAY